MSGVMGVGKALVQLPEIDERHVHTGFNFAMLFGFAVAGVIWTFSPAFAELFQMPRLAPVLSVLAWMFPLKALSKASRSFLQRELAYRKLAGIDVASYVAYGIVGITLAYLGAGVWALVWATLAQKAVQSVILFTLQPHSVRLSFHPSVAKELLFYGSGFTAVTAFGYAATRGDNFVVGRWLGASALGIYGRAYGLMNATNSVLGHVVNKVFFPAFSKAQDEPARLARAYRRGMGLTAMLILPISAASIILAPELVNTLLGDQWGEVVLPFQILAVGMVCRLGYKVGGTLATGTGAVYRHAWRKAVHAVLICGGGWLAQDAGVVGVAVSTLVALVVVTGLTVHLALKITGLPLAQLARACLPALPLSAFVGGLTFGVATVLRLWNVSSAAVLVIAFIAVGGSTFGLLAMLPGWLLNKEGRWLFKKAAGFIPAERGPVLRWFYRRLDRMATAA
jgi:PST family polysaccharide transporter